MSATVRSPGTTNTTRTHTVHQHHHLHHHHHHRRHHHHHLLRNPAQPYSTQWGTDLVSFNRTHQPTLLCALHSLLLLPLLPNPSPMRCEQFAASESRTQNNNRVRTEILRILRRELRARRNGRALGATDCAPLCVISFHAALACCCFSLAVVMVCFTFLSLELPPVCFPRVGLGNPSSGLLPHVCTPTLQRLLSRTVPAEACIVLNSQSHNRPLGMGRRFTCPGH